MSLKKPKSIPGIPKSRKKNPDKIKKTVPAKKSDQTEYACNVYFSYNPSKKNQRYAVEIETIKLFSVLNYNLSVESRKAKNVIDISILGLKATNNYTNEPGPASSIVYFDELYGDNTINIIKQDGSVNTALFNFNVFKKSIELIDVSVPEKKNNSRFCEFKVAEEKFTFD
jgi:hypothetical protein